MRSVRQQARRRTVCGRSRCRGSVILETAVALPLLAVILFGIAEVGVIGNEMVELTRVSREATRGASRGWTPEQIGFYVNGLTSIDPDRLTVTSEYQAYDSDTGTYGAWTPLISVGPCNNARDGDRVRVSLRYQHEFTAGGLFSGLVEDPDSGTMELSAKTTLRRD